MIAALGALTAVWAGHLAYYAPRMPPRMANHFTGSGRPNEWMARETLIQLDVLLFGFLFALLVGISFLVRHLPVEWINVPHRDYWFAEQRRPASSERLFRHMLWLTCLVLVLLIAVNHLVFQAHLRGDGPRLDGTGVIVCMGGFVVGLAAWTVRLFALFPRPRQAG